MGRFGEIAGRRYAAGYDGLIAGEVFGNIWDMMGISELEWAVLGGQSTAIIRFQHLAKPHHNPCLPDHFSIPKEYFRT